MRVTNSEIVSRLCSAMIAFTVLTSSAILCAPSQQAGQSASTAKLGAASSTTAASTPKPAATSSPTKAGVSSVMTPSASITEGSPSLVHLPASGAAELDTFDGKNPFADDSLWKIPVHLVRDLSASDGSSHEGLAKSASENSQADADERDNDDDDEPISSGPQVNLQPSSSSSPTIISASTDLKAAAGYHYPTHGHHGYEGGHDSHGYGGHGAGHHGGDHYGGKYFQYASVPYPYAWEFGYRRGNPYHTIERHEHGKGPHFQTKVKWSDKHGGYGVHVWDYNHDDHHSHHYGGHHGGHGYGHH